ncbi:unnamed protein product [Prorocentrum cordatum]|uniref:Uncharacterized protein n=1 Tax=Prorocentrum cordatum TaxID=2364126 RepID=A0ABN9UQ38_9DINO|nr:unnamed protein product [Polarella glacialis]
MGSGRKTSLVLNVLVSSVQDPTDKIITPKETAWVPGKMARESPNCQQPTYKKHCGLEPLLYTPGSSCSTSRSRRQNGASRGARLGGSANSGLHNQRARHAAWVCAVR